MSENKIKIAKDIAAYSGSGILVQNISFFLAIFIRRVLGPEGMGIWAILQVFMRYASYANLGMFDAMYRDIPMRRGRDDLEGAQKTKNLAFTFTAIASFLASAVIIAAAFFYRGNLSRPLFVGFLCLAALNFFEKINNLFIGFLQVDKRFDFISRFRVVSAAVNALFIIPLVWFFDIYGYLAAMVFSMLFNIKYLYSRVHQGLRFDWHLSGVRNLLAFGVPYLGYSLVNTTFLSIDRLAVAKFFGLTSLGLYTLATMATGYLAMIPNMTQQVLSPRVLEMMGDPALPGSAEGPGRMTVLSLRLVAIYFGFFIGGIWIAGPAGCLWLLPKFAEGLPSLKILVAGSAFSAFSLQLYAYLLGRQKHWAQIPVCFLLAGCVWLASAFYSDSLGLVGISAMISLAYLVHYFYSSYLAYASQKHAGFHGFAEAAMNSAPIILSLLAGYVLDYFFSGNQWEFVLLKSVLFLGVWGVFLIFFEKHYRAIGTVREIMKGFRK